MNDVPACEANNVLEHSIKLNSLGDAQVSIISRLTAHDTCLDRHATRLQSLETSSVMHKREVDEVLKSMKSLKNAMWSLVVVVISGVLGFIFEVIGRMLP